MIQEIDLTTNSRRATSIDMSMSYTGSPLHAEYGKALFKHHQYMRNHFVERLSGLSRDDLTNFPLLSIPGVISLHTTNQTIKFGSWRVVTTNNPSVATQIDTYIHKHYLTVSYDFPKIAPASLPNQSPRPPKRRGFHKPNILLQLHPPEECLVSNPTKIIQPKLT